jgi:hypothetical protein
VRVHGIDLAPIQWTRGAAPEKRKKQLSKVCVTRRTISRRRLKKGGKMYHRYVSQDAHFRLFVS